ncbi:hypothetical protein MESS2_p130010 [Mesorhizobium metallidurans STM 2683]|uniref:Uncharacterized protein n=1 Tax=Mesorhizobium metallidurans STM 2683 TaxID=1297569 RepID=M5EWM9_9HYPH|nr:hypothetical protein MESS2_p130010 [Mesorhizobium metallidurans STM 2683]
MDRVGCDGGWDAIATLLMRDSDSATAKGVGFLFHHRELKNPAGPKLVKSRSGLASTISHWIQHYRRKSHVSPTTVAV